jgi:hypothetical protein
VFPCCEGAGRCSDHVLSLTAEFADLLVMVFGIADPLAVPDLVLHPSEADLHCLQSAFDLEYCGSDKRVNGDDHLLGAVQIEKPPREKYANHGKCCRREHAPIQSLMMRLQRLCQFYVHDGSPCEAPSTVAMLRELLARHAQQTGAHGNFAKKSSHKNRVINADDVGFSHSLCEDRDHAVTLRRRLAASTGNLQPGISTLRTQACGSARKDFGSASQANAGAIRQRRKEI